MTPDEIAIATADRFASWGKFLREQQATPLMMIGLSFPECRPIITTVEEITDAEAEQLLEGILNVLRRGRRQPQTRPRGETGTTVYTLETGTT